MIKGKFIATNKTDSGILVRAVTISEIPVTPPSIKELGNKKPFKPKLAEAIATKMNKNSLIRWLISISTLLAFLSMSAFEVFFFFLSSICLTVR